MNLAIANSFCTNTAKRASTCYSFCSPKPQHQFESCLDICNSKLHVGEQFLSRLFEQQSKPRLST